MSKASIIIFALSVMYSSPAAAQADYGSGYHAEFLTSLAEFSEARQKLDAYIDQVALGVTAKKNKNIPAPDVPERLSYNTVTEMSERGELKLRGTSEVLLASDAERGYVRTQKNKNSVYISGDWVSADNETRQAAPSAMLLLSNRRILENARVMPTRWFNGAELQGSESWQISTVIRSEGNAEALPAQIGVASNYLHETTDDSISPGKIREYINCVPLASESITVSDIEHQAVKVLCGRIHEMSGLTWSKEPIIQTMVITKWKSLSTGIDLKSEVDSRSSQTPDLLRRTIVNVTTIY